MRSFSASIASLTRTRGIAQAVREAPSSSLVPALILGAWMVYAYLGVLGYRAILLVIDDLFGFPCRQGM